MRALRLPRPAVLVAGALLAFGTTGGAVSGVAVAADAAGGVPAADAAPRGHVVVLGVDGLEWSDVTPQTMPTLATLGGQGALASLVTRAAEHATCPADGWLTLGTGTRATGGRAALAPSGADPLSSAPRQDCAALPATPPVGGPFTIPDYSSYTEPNAAFGYGPVFGALAAPVRRAGGCVAAAGAGALLAAADAHGRVDDYLGPPTALTAAQLDACALTLVDLGGFQATDASAATLFPPPISRATVFSGVDARIAALLPQLPIDSTLVVAGLDDADQTSPRLHALLATGQIADGSAFTPGRWLYASSTRIDGLVQSTDLAPSLLRWIGLTHAQIAAAEPEPFSGSVVVLGSPAPEGEGAAVAAAGRLETANIVYQQTNGVFATSMERAVLILVFAAFLAFLLARLPADRPRRAMLGTLAAIAAVLGAVAPASYLAGLDDWWAADHPAARLYGLTAVLAVLLGLLAVAVTRFSRLRDRPLAPAGLLSLLTLMLVAGDVSGGSRLQRQTPFGLSFVTADRFLGIGESAVGVYCAAAMIGTVFAVSLLVPRRGPGTIPPAAARPDRRYALALVFLFAAFAMLACGYPTWGGELGAAIAMVPGFALLAFVVAGRRPSRHRVLIALIVLVCVVAAVSIWAGAAHRGISAGFGTGFDTGFGTGFDRGYGTGFGAIAEGWFGRLVPWIMLACLLALVMPRLIGSRSLAVVFAREPYLRCALFLALLTCAIGWIVDGAGVLVPETGLLSAVPLAVCACALGLLRAFEAHTATEADTDTADEAGEPCDASASRAPESGRDLVRRQSADQ